MKTTIENIDDKNFTIHFDVEWSEIAQDYQEVVQQYTDKNIPGFRKGRVPVKIIESRYGKTIRADACQISMHRTFDQIAYEQAILPAVVTQFTPGEYSVSAPFSFDVTYIAHPDEFEMPDYKAIKLESKPQTEQEEDDAADKISETLTAATEIEFPEELILFEMQQAQGSEPFDSNQPDKARNDAIDRLKLILISRRIAILENIVMSEDDWHTRIADIAKQYQKPHAFLEKLWTQRGAMGRLKTLMYAEKVLAQLVKNNESK